MIERIIPYVMLIDDDVATTVYNELIIEDSNCVKKVMSVNSAEEALSYLNSSENEIKPNLILLDINMPTMDGWDFLEAFEQLDEEDIKKTVIIMLSTSTDKDECEKVKQHMLLKGIKSKPLTFEDVEEIREMYFGKKQKEWCHN